jgi:hypothetical protein
MPAEYMPSGCSTGGAPPWPAALTAGLELRGGRQLRQWRVDAGSALPVFSAANGIAGHHRHASGDYLHATKSIALHAVAVRAEAGFYLESANAKLVSWDTAGGTQQLRFDGHLPLHASFVAPRCELQPAPGQKATRRGDRLDVEASSLGPTLVVLRCAG